MQVDPAIRLYLSSIGRRGGSAGTGKAKARTTKQAKKAALAMWEKRRKGNQQAERKVGT